MFPNPLRCGGRDLLSLTLGAQGWASGLTSRRVKASLENGRLIAPFRVGLGSTAGCVSTVGIHVKLAEWGEPDPPLPRPGNRPGAFPRCLESLGFLRDVVLPLHEAVPVLLGRA